MFCLCVNMFEVVMNDIFLESINWLKGLQYYPKLMQLLWLVLLLTIDSCTGVANYTTRKI